MSTYKDKLKPIATPPTYKSKLKPIATVSSAPMMAPKPAKKVGYFGRVKAQVAEDAATRAPKIREILNAGKTGKQSKLATGFQLGGQAIGAAFDAPLAAVEEAIPQFAKKAVKKAIFNPLAKGINLAADKISDIPAVQKFAMTDKGQEFARNIEAVPEYLNLVPAPKATKFIAKATEKTVGDLGTKAVGTVRNFAEQQATKRATKAVKEIDELAGRIAQGTPEDIPDVAKALSNIETKGVKTYKQLGDRIGEKIKVISEKLDEVLAKNPTTRTLPNLTTVVNNGGQKVQTNFVSDALAQLENFFQKTNDLRGQAQVKGVMDKANTTGMTIKDINDLAKIHGSELSGFNLNGELASGLSKQAAENTRKGLKAIARDLYGDKLYQAADGEITSLISTRDLVEKMTDAVNKLNQKVMKRSLGQRAGRLMFQVANLFSFGSLKGFVEAALPRGQGLKTLNAIDLQKYLGKNLGKIERLLDSRLPEDDIVAKLQEIIDSATEEKRLLLPAAGQTGFPTRNTISLPQSARETNLGLDEVRGASINQSRAFPANQPNTINASNTAQNVDIKPVIPRNDAIVDPYIPEDQLPVIQMGRLPKRKPISGPVVDYGTNPEVFGGEAKIPVVSKLKANAEPATGQPVEILGFRGGKGTSPNGTFYSPDKEVAGAYAKRKGGNITQENIQLQKPLVVPADHFDALYDMMEKLPAKDPLRKEIEKAIPHTSGNKYVLMPAKKAGELYEQDIIKFVDPVFKKYAERFGFDGIIRVADKAPWGKKLKNRIFEIVKFNK